VFEYGETFNDYYFAIANVLLNTSVKEFLKSVKLTDYFSGSPCMQCIV